MSPQESLTATLISKGLQSKDLPVFAPDLDLRKMGVKQITDAIKGIGAHLFWSLNLRVDAGFIHSWLDVSMWVRRNLDTTQQPPRFERIGAKAVPLYLRVVDCNDVNKEFHAQQDGFNHYYRPPQLDVRDDHIHFKGDYALRVVMPSIYQIIPAFLQRLKQRAYQLSDQFDGTNPALSGTVVHDPNLVPDPNLYPENITLRASVENYNRPTRIYSRVEPFTQQRGAIGLMDGILQPSDTLYPIWFMYQSDKANKGFPTGQAFIEPPFAFFGEVETSATDISTNNGKERERKLYWEVNGDNAQSVYLSDEYYLTEFDEQTNPNPGVMHLQKNIRHLLIQQDGEGDKHVFEQWVDKIRVGQHAIKQPTFKFPLERTSFIIGGLPMLEDGQRKLLGLRGKLYSFTFDPNESCSDCPT